MEKSTYRIVILSQYYPPETGAPQNRLSDLAIHFKNVGYDVRLLTAKPNYPIGKIYPGFEKGFSQESVQDGIPVTHCWIYASNKNLLHRLLNYLSFLFSSIIVGLRRLHKTDLIIVESPPLFLSISGWLLSRIKGAKLVLNVSDLYPETAVVLGLIKNKLIIRIFYLLEKWSYHVSDLITGQTMGIVQSIKTRYPKKSVYLLKNGMDLEKINVDEKALVKKTGEKTEDFIIGYAGIIGYGQGLENLFAAAKNLQDVPKIKFYIYGDGPLKTELELKTRELSIHNIKFKGHYPHHEILELMPNWDIGLVPLADTPLMGGALPSKMFEMMAMQLPILLIAPQGEASEVIEKATAGIWVQPGLSETITQAIIRLYKDPKLRTTLGRNAYKCVLKNYNRSKIFNDFHTFLISNKII